MNSTSTVLKKLIPTQEQTCTNQPVFRILWHTKTFLKTKVGFVAFTVSDLETDRVYFHSPGARKGHLFEWNIYNSNLVRIRHITMKYATRKHSDKTDLSVLKTNHWRLHLTCFTGACTWTPTHTHTHTYKDQPKIECTLLPRSFAKIIGNFWSNPDGKHRTVRRISQHATSLNNNRLRTGRENRRSHTCSYAALGARSPPVIGLIFFWNGAPNVKFTNFMV